MSEKVRTINPTVLFRDNLLRFVLPYRTLTRRGDFAPFCLILARDRLEAHPPAGEFIDKFLFYNATKTVRENIKNIINEVFKDVNEQLLQEVEVDIETKLRAIEQIRKYLDGVAPNENVVYGAFLRERIHFGKVLISAGQDFGSIRYQIRSLTATTFIPFIFPVKISEIITFYELAYERIGRPYVARASHVNPELIKRVRKYSELQVDDVLDLVVDTIGDTRLLAIATHLILIGKDGALHLDAKRCLSIPPPARITDVVIIQSQDVGIVALYYDMPLAEMKRYVRMLTLDIVKRYRTGAISERELSYLPQKISKNVYGATVTEEEQIGEQIRITLFGFGGGGSSGAEETTAGGSGGSGEGAAGGGSGGGSSESTIGGEQI